ncbi:MAG: uncharacterized protein JWQ42_3108 [Edaphobacter sp.]|nr:uncharacterized protein [Edaphobacter sp.]
MGGFMLALATTRLVRRLRSHLMDQIRLSDSPATKVWLIGVFDIGAETTALWPRFALRFSGLLRQQGIAPKNSVNYLPMWRSPLVGFNWGAFFLTWIWSIRNRSLNFPTIVLLFLCLTPHLGLVFALALAIYSGITGNQRAWRNARWRDSQHFIHVQRCWAMWGLVQCILAVVLLFTLPVFYDK